MISGNVNLEISNFAICKVKAAIKNEKKDLSEYKTIVKKIPTLILNNGLISTLVFLLSKDKKSHKLALDAIVEWTIKSSKINQDIKDKLEVKDRLDLKTEVFIEKITNLNAMEYKNLTRETINLFVWIKRFADGLIKD